jgi:hypothetical protein
MQFVGLTGYVFNDRPEEILEALKRVIEYSSLHLRIILI